MANPVYLRGAPPWPFGTMSRDVARAFILYTGVDPLDLSSFKGKGYLLVLTAFDSSLLLEIPAPPLPFGTVARRRARYLTVQGKLATTYPAASGNAARTTKNDDTPAAQYVPGKLSTKFNYSVSVFAGTDPTKGGGTATVGILELIDTDGELDGLRTLGWDGAIIDIRRGDPDGYFNTYTTVARLTAADMRSPTLRRKEIRLRDLGWQLTKAELHGQRYGATGGIDGDPNIPSLKGRIKPICFGPVFNITPVQINAALMIYQVSCTSVLGIDDVRDGGVSLTPGADYATYDLLAAASVPAGTFATCKAFGLFRLGSAAVFIITADVRGDNDTINSLTYPHTRGQIAKRIATGRGNLKLRDPQDIDASTFDALDQKQTANVGRFYDSEITKAAALTDLMAGCAGWWSVGVRGLLSIGQLEDPATLARSFTLDYAPTTSESRLGEPAMIDYQLPRRNTLMGWRRNYTKMETNQIAGSVSQANSSIYQGVGNFAPAENLWVAAGYPSADVVTVDGGFETEAAAQAEANRQMRLFGQVREVFSIPAQIDPFADVVGRVGEILNSNRLGLGSTSNAFCFGIAVNANRKPILQLWK